MIGISTVVFDLEGFIVIPSHKLKGDNEIMLSRRVSSTKTLDGGVFVSDFGYAPTDDNISVVAIGVPLDDIRKLKDIIKLHSLLRITTKEGAFICVMQTMHHQNNELTIELLKKGIA